MQFKSFLLASGCSILLASCANLAPQYKRPDVAMTNAWMTESLKDDNNTASAQTQQWRDFFRDPLLHSFIAEALTHNHDIRQAALKTLIAQRRLGIVSAERLPTLGVNAQQQRSRAPIRGVAEQYSVNLGLAQFELDFFSRVKNLSTAALNQYLQTQEARDSAQLSIINAVAQTYFQWCAEREMLQLATQLERYQKQSQKLIQLRYKEGMASRADLNRGTRQLAATRSARQQHIRGMQAANNSLAALIGKPLQARTMSPLPLAQQLSQQPIHAGIPSQVLINRPDVRQAEYALKAANANIGAARASMFPRISLTGNAGYISSDLGSLFDPVSRIWSFLPRIDIPLFDAGRRANNVVISELQQQVAVSQYQKTVQSAFQEVADGLVAQKTLAQQLKADKQQVASAQDDLRIAKLREQEGLSSHAEVLAARQQYLRTQQALIARRLQSTVNTVKIYNALGGHMNDRVTPLPTAHK